VYLDLCSYYPEVVDCRKPQRRQKGNALKRVMLLLPAKVDEFLSRKEKKAAGLEQHKKLQREKELKRKEKKQISLPAKHSKGKK
jgi:hypothetical protein